MKNLRLLGSFILVLLVFVHINAQSSDAKELNCDEKCVSDAVGLLNVNRQGYSIGFWEKVNHRMGDRTAVALRLIYPKEEIHLRENINVMLGVIGESFVSPRLISDEAARDPARTLKLLRDLRNHTDDPSLSSRITVLIDELWKQSRENPKLTSCDEKCVRNVEALLWASIRGSSPPDLTSNYSLGDHVALGLRLMLSDKELTYPSLILKYLVIIERSFMFPDLISNDSAKEPIHTLELLEQLKNCTADTDLRGEIDRLIEKLKGKIVPRPVSRSL